MEPYRSFCTYTSSIMKISKVDYSFQTKNYHRSIIMKADLFTHSNRCIRHCKNKYFRNSIKTHNVVYFSITLSTPSSGMTFSKSLLQAYRGGTVTVIVT